MMVKKSVMLVASCLILATSVSAYAGSPKKCEISQDRSKLLNVYRPYNMGELDYTHAYDYLEKVSGKIVKLNWEGEVLSGVVIELKTGNRESIALVSEENCPRAGQSWVQPTLVKWYKEKKNVVFQVERSGSAGRASMIGAWSK